LIDRSNERAHGFAAWPTNKIMGRLLVGQAAKPRQFAFSQKESSVSVI